MTDKELRKRELRQEQEMEEQIKKRDISIIIFKQMIDDFYDSIDRKDKRRLHHEYVTKENIGRTPQQRIKISQENYLRALICNKLLESKYSYLVDNIVSLRDLGYILGISYERIRQEEGMAIRKLKIPKIGLKLTKVIDNIIDINTVPDYGYESTSTGISTKGIV